MSSTGITKHNKGKLRLIWDDPRHPCNCLAFFIALHGFVNEILLLFSFELYSGSTQSIAKIFSFLSVTLKHDCCIRISISISKGKSLKQWNLARKWSLARYHLKWNSPYKVLDWKSDEMQGHMVCGLYEWLFPPRTLTKYIKLCH